LKDEKMALVLNEEQQMLKDAARDFLAEKAPVSHLRGLRDNADETGYSRDLWNEMVEMGWSGIMVDEQYGGLEFGLAGLGVIMEEAGRTLTPSPLFSTALLGTAALQLSGNDKQCQDLLPGVIAGDTILALAADEGARHQPHAMQTTASGDGEMFSISGVKTSVIDGHVADHLIVAARTSGQASEQAGISLFLVPAKAQGVSIERTIMVDAHNSATVTLDSVKVGAEAVLGALDDAASLLERVWDLGRIGQAAELLGVSLRAFEMTLEYLQQRKQFGVPVGSFQALQHRSADLFGELELLKSVVLKALQAADENAEDLPLLASLAKAKAAQVASKTCCEAIQMHGGIGMTDEYDLGFYIKRAKVLSQQLGGESFHLDRFAKLRGY
jgi:alkylation response protein AidB-like acyl-CoA dehydrogenase